jgi:hypothetical protein
VERIDAAIARQRRGKHVYAATNQQATIEDLLEAAFSMRSMPRLYSEDQREKSVGSRSRRLAVLSCIVSNRYLAMTSEKNRKLHVHCSFSDL